MQHYITRTHCRPLHVIFSCPGCIYFIALSTRLQTYMSSGEMEISPIQWRLRKQDLLRVSSSCLVCSESVSSIQRKVLGDKALSLSCLSDGPPPALLRFWVSQSLLSQLFLFLSILSLSCCLAFKSKFSKCTIMSFSHYIYLCKSKKKKVQP